MWKWLIRKKKTVAGRAPFRPRIKTYSARTGLVYQYVYLGAGSRTTGEQKANYVFSIDRRTQPNSFELTVHLSDKALAECAVRLGRAVQSNEQYAIAKLTLFQALDDYPDPERNPLLTPTTDDMEGHLRSLGRF